ncbi:putative 60S ribosomal protein l37 protein [Rosellinia necatrix]|uniref:Putative 60S ribosomal protein l37 protein n=1 Tax=Rosellinia necatrix TaxID=77044 RepID=A0A1W2TS23_ROSNE|nr:putative 60S ribosomal protein l37 protein [Rosellinia necatrix]
MATRTPEQILAELRALVANQEITILKLGEPIAAEIAHLREQSQRTSDASNASLDATTPASLEADLTHYQELFAKLRFSYVEQVSKEKFIRAIVGDPPLIVSPQENIDLEKQNLEAKAMLKALKTEVADMVAALEDKAKDLSRKYERIKTETAKLEELPDKLDELEIAVAKLKTSQVSALHSKPELNLPLAKTLELVEAKKRQRDELDRQLEQLQSQVPRKTKELERLHAELQPLEAKRQNSTAAAKEARRRKEAALGGVEDDLEERGRWYRAAEAGMRQMLEIER